MSPEQIAGLAPALTEFLGVFRNCLGECRLMEHFVTYSRGLLSNLQRKSVEPIALAAGSTVRALQMFLTDRVWDHLRLRDRMQQRIAALHAPVPGTPRAPDDVALGNGLHFDWLVFDEGYGKDPAFLFDLDALGQTWIGEVPKNFRCWPVLPQYHSGRQEFASKKVYNVVRWSLAFSRQDWKPVTCLRQTVAPVVWHVKAAQVHLVNQGRPTDRTYWLIVAWNRATKEYKYFVSNASPRTPLAVLLQVAFRRAEVEHLFRVVKGEVGLGHFEGRSYVGLMRHLILCQLLILFLAEQTARLNAERAATAQPPTMVALGKKNARQDPPGPPSPGTDTGDSQRAAHHDGADRGIVELPV
jgi:hypothetical protein